MTVFERETKNQLVMLLISAGASLFFLCNFYLMSHFSKDKHSFNKQTETKKIPSKKKQATISENINLYRSKA